MANTHPFGQMLHNYRMRAGLTLRNVAEVSGYSEPYLSKNENGLVHRKRDVEAVLDGDVKNC